MLFCADNTQGIAGTTSLKFRKTTLHNNGLQFTMLITLRNVSQSKSSLLPTSHIVSWCSRSQPARQGGRKSARRPYVLGRQARELSGEAAGFLIAFDASEC